jgi:TonB family protein
MIWNPRKRTAALLPLLLSLLIPSAVLAQEAPQPSQSQTPALLFGGVEPMVSGQKKVVDLLLAKKWREARNLAGQQFLALAGHVEKYPGLAATALALEALADAGLGDEGAAACRWQAAQNVDPKLANADLSLFETAGAMLKRHPFQAPSAPNPETHRVTPPGKDPDQGGKGDAEVKRPEILFQQPPVYTLAARRERVSGKVVVEVIIDKGGNVTNPNILEPQPKGLDLAAVNAVCAWRFKPATMKGKPVKVYYVLTVNFKVEEGPPPPSRSLDGG